MSKTANILSYLTLLLMLGACDKGGDDSPPWASPDIVVDFSQEESVGSLSGFLGALHPDVVQESRVAPLRPAHWRAHLDEETLQRAESLGIRFIYVLSDEWGYPNNLLGPNPDPPYADWDRFEAAMAEQARRFGTRVVYDVWNEPDVPVFWGIWDGADYEKFLETFGHAHDAIRSELGDEAVISGPSVSFFNFDRIQRFADYCLENGLKVQILSMHLLYQTDSALPEVEEGLKRIRSEILDNPKYEAVGFEELHVNEYVMAYRQNVRPGSVLAFLRHMERAGVDGACKACWGHPADCPTALDCYFGFGGWSTCGDGSINGLLTPEGDPRAVWWAYRYYAEGVASRVEAESSNRLLMPLASGASAQERQAQVMVAHYGDRADPPPPIDLELGDLNLLQIDPLDQPTDAIIELRNLSSLPFLDEAPGEIRVDIVRIPFEGLGDQPVSEPLVVEENLPVRTRDGTAQIALESIGAYETFVILVKEAP